MKTILIHNGATPKGIEVIKKLLAGNNLATSKIKNRVICIDTPESVCKLQDFSSQEELTFYALDPPTSIAINETIDKVIVVNK